MQKEACVTSPNSVNHLLVLCSLHGDNCMRWVTVDKKNDSKVSRTFLNIVLDNRNKFTPVRSSMFVPKTDSMTNLVHDNSKFVAVLSNRNPLAPIPLPSNVGTAATRSVNRKYIIQSTSVSGSLLFIYLGKVIIIYSI